MRTYPFSLENARLAWLLTVTRVDGTVIRVTGYSGDVTIDSVTWEPEPGITIGDYTENNWGDLPNLTFKVAMRDGGPFEKADINNRLYERSEAVLSICDARTQTAKKDEIYGVLKGKVSFDLDGNADFEFLNKFALVRDVFVKKNTIEDNVYFGDPRWNKIPTFPTVDETSDDLADVGRNEAIFNGERRRFRYASAGNPSDYHNVYWEADGTGTTGDTAPVAPSDTPGASVTDGGVTWVVRNAYARSFQVASIIDETHITITVTEPRATDEDWFNPGQIVMRSGYLKNHGSLVDAWDGVSQIGLEKPIGNLLEVGDWGEIAPDYDQTLDMAVDKYGTALTTFPGGADGGNLNFRGLPHITGARIFVSTHIGGVTVDSAADADDPGAGEGGGGGGGGEYEPFAVEFESGST